MVNIVDFDYFRFIFADSKIDLYNVRDCFPINSDSTKIRLIVI